VRLHHFNSLVCQQAPRLNGSSCCATAQLRYCATAPAHPLPWIAFAKKGAALVYRCAKQRSAPTSDKPGAKVDELHLTLLELIDRIAALMPPPRTHRHRYFGVLASNSPLRDAVTAPAAPAQALPLPVQPAQAVVGESSPIQGVPPKRSPSHYLWAVLIARIYEVSPLLCPICGGQMRSIAARRLSGFANLGQVAQVVMLRNELFVARLFVPRYKVNLKF